jgi:DNA-directed RNA polymerase subunit N (RpoN/RPB10)
MPLPKRPYSKRGDKEECVKHPLYITWHNMMRRCYFEKDNSFLNYGARGIVVCKEWHRFKNFLKDMGDKPSKYHSLDRIDNDLGYSKYNCRWATRSQQCDNRRTFKNNTSGERGIQKTNFGFSARYDYERVRYHIGHFITFQEAVEARKAFIKMLHLDKEQAIKSISNETVWNNSKTKVRGVTPHVDGGYIVRVGVKGVRHYIGYFKTIEEASDARHKFIKERTG